MYRGVHCMDGKIVYGAEVIDQFMGMPGDLAGHKKRRRIRGDKSRAGNDRRNRRPLRTKRLGEFELKTSPCKGCIFREPECHGSCRQYKAWSKSMRKENDLKRTEHWKNAPSPWKRESSIEHRARTGRTGRRER